MPELRGIRQLRVVYWRAKNHNFGAKKTHGTVILVPHGHIIILTTGTSSHHAILTTSFLDEKITQHQSNKNKRDANTNEAT